MTDAIWMAAYEHTLHEFTCHSIMGPYRPSRHSMTIDLCTTMQGVFLPTSQSLLVYVSLAAGCCAWLVFFAPPDQRSSFANRLPGRNGNSIRDGRQQWQHLSKFAALALIDMEANFLLNKAYRYTSITSVTLLDCASIPGDQCTIPLP
jgi:Solute carrier family 35